MPIYPNIRNLVLASASPRRRELLTTLGIPFTVAYPELDETPLPDEPPRSFAERMAKEKAEAIRIDSDHVLIAADTIVVLGSAILGKPRDEPHAFEMLSALSGKHHQVITGVCIRKAETLRVFSVSTDVLFRELGDQEIEAYIASGDPMDKAGAYAIQGGAAHMIHSITGSYTNIVGLPLCELHTELLSF